jgi:hypothetical protein
MRTWAMARAAIKLSTWKSSKWVGDNAFIRVQTNNPISKNRKCNVQHIVRLFLNSCSRGYGNIKFIGLHGHCVYQIRAAYMAYSKIMEVCILQSKATLLLGWSNLNTWFFSIPWILMEKSPKVLEEPLPRKSHTSLPSQASMDSLVVSSYKPKGF